MPVIGLRIAGPGYLGGLRSISEPDADALYELVALTDGTLGDTGSANSA